MPNRPTQVIPDSLAERRERVMAMHGRLGRALAAAAQVFRAALSRWGGTRGATAQETADPAAQRRLPHSILIPWATSPRRIEFGQEVILGRRAS